MIFNKEIKEMLAAYHLTNCCDEGCPYYELCRTNIDEAWKCTLHSIKIDLMEGKD